MPVPSAVLRLILLVACAALGGSLGAARAVGAQEAARTTGVVRDSLSGALVRGARIEVLGADATVLASARSADDGAFVLGAIPAGATELRVTALGYRPFVVPAARVGGGTDIEIALERAPVPLSAVVVTPGTFGMMAPGIATPQAMSRRQLETVPQIGEDIYRAVSRLPGVSANDFSAKFAVRGGSGDELYVTLDGLELIEPFHLKDIAEGGLSIIDGRAIGGLELVTGGFGAEYGDRLTGVFTMRSVDPSEEQAATSVGLSVMNARVTSQGRFRGGRGGWLASARRGYIDLALRLAGEADSLEPRYSDYFGKVQYDLPGGGRVAAHVLHAGDRLEYIDTPTEPAISSRYASSYAWVTLDGRLGERLAGRTVLSLSRLRWHRDGEGDDEGVRTAFVADRRAYSALGARQDWTLDVARRLMLKWGADVRLEGARYDYLSQVRKQELVPPDRVRTRTEETRVAEEPGGTRLGTWAAVRAQPAPELAVEVGVRGDRASYGGAFVGAPRLNVSWQPRAGTTLRGAWGGYSQSQPIHLLQAQDGATRFDETERAEQRVLGVEQELPGGVLARAEVYERRVTDARPRHINVGPGIEVFPELTWDRLRIEPTGGRARGLELLLARDGGRRTSWSASYVLAEATDRIGGVDVPRVIDQRHTLHADWSLRPASDRWQLSVSGVWHSGWPYTPAGIVVDTLANSRDRFTLFLSALAGPLNSERNDPYHRIDVRWTRWFAVRGGRIAAFVEVFNLLDAANTRGYFANLEIGTDRDVRVWYSPSESIPRLPTVGVTWEW